MQLTGLENDRQTLKSNTIKEAIVRFDFQEISELENENDKATNQIVSKVKETLPKLERKLVKEITVKDGKNQKSPKISQTQVNELIVCYDHEKLSSFTMGKSYIAYSENKYISAKSFIPKFKALYQYLIDEYPSLEVTRVGLRFINIIDFQDLGLDQSRISDYIKSADEFSSPLGKDIANTMKNYTIVLDDGIGINLNQGLVDKQKDGKNIGKGYLIDIDCFIENEKGVSNEFEYIEKFDGYIWNLFRGSISDKLFAAIK